MIILVKSYIKRIKLSNLGSRVLIIRNLERNYSLIVSEN